MRNTGAVLSFVLGLAALSYAAFATLQGGDKPAPPAAARMSPQDTAARDRMAQLVAEVAARTAAETAKKVVLSHSQAQGQSRVQQVAATEVAQKSVSR